MNPRRWAAWLWPAGGVIAALAASPIAVRLTSNEGLYSLILAPLVLILWAASDVRLRAMGLRLGTAHAYGLAFAWPAATMILVALIAWAIGGIRATTIPFGHAARGILVLFAFTLVVGLLTEEGFFRGWLWGAMEEHSHALGTRILGTSVAFGLWHIGAALVMPSVHMPAARLSVYVANVFLLGVVFALLRAGSGSIIVASVAHAAWNAFQYVFYGIGTTTGVLTAAASGWLDPERGALGLAFNAAAALLLWRWARRALIEAGRPREHVTAT